MALQVTAPLVIVGDGTGRLHHFYRDAILPEGLDKDHLQQIVDQGMVEETDNPTVPETPEQPAKSANKDAWIAWARSQGAEDDDVDGKTKDALIEEYGE